ncbi:MAG: glycosyltransferase family 87 protein, partial [Bryocella sp.]
YPSAISGDFYSLFYGPATYLIYAPWMNGHLTSLLPLRLAVSLADAASVALIYAALRPRLARAEAMAALCVTIIVVMPYPDEFLGLRGDPWLLLACSLAMFLSLRPRSRWTLSSMLIAGAAMGLAIDVKITAVPVACLVAAIALRRFGKAAALIALVSAAVVSLSVFLLHGISFREYVFSLHTASHQPLLRSNLLLESLVLLVLLLPALRGGVRQAIRIVRQRAGTIVLTTGLVSLAICMVAGSKYSAGPWHLWPLVPFLVATAIFTEAKVLIPSDIKVPTRISGMAYATSLAIAGCVVALLWGATDMKMLCPLLSQSFRRAEVVDAIELRQDVTSDHGRNVVMGYGNNLNDERTNLRYRLILAGERYDFDENEVVEAQKASVKIPAAALLRIQRCDDDWILPHGDTPFSAIKDWLVPGDNFEPMFPAALRSSFSETYTLAKAGTAYDLWSCRANLSKKL